MERVLVVEDGFEYIHNLTRFLGSDFSFERAGDGFAALEMLSGGSFSAIFLDMKFDRAEKLLGDLAQLHRRFAGDESRARRFLENNQGTYVLAAIRDAGVSLPIVFSYDFDSEPRRFRNLHRRYAPLSYLTDTASPAQMRQTFRDAIDAR
ncbi:MAG: response regulator [Myxococcota bacterium]|nr:response regulator [Myxococcota bacterium]